MVSISELAADKVKRFLDKRGKGLGIKIGVKTTGCSGLAYILEYIDVLDDTLAVFMSNKTMIFIDPKHLPYLTGIHIDWVREGLNEGFEFTNPNEKNKCGCGESFNV